MKKVLLLGDQICINYQERVKALLSDIAEVVFLPFNPGYTASTLWCLRYEFEELCKACDLIHWNTGLWDHHRTLDDGEPLINAEQYLHFTRRLHRQIDFYTKRQIFATTTPAGEGYQYDKNGIYGIPKDDWNREVAEYNAIATAYLQNQGVSVNDLYALITEHPEYLADDGIELSEAGVEAVAQQVAASIRACLAAALKDNGAEENAPDPEQNAGDKTPPLDWIYLNKNE